MSATYSIFRQMFLTGDLGARTSGDAPIPVNAALIRSTYVFNPAHTSFATSIRSHAIWEFAAPSIPYHPSDYRLPEAAFKNGPYDVLTPAGQTANAVVVFSPAGVPFFYLDAETFPGLPAVTLGGPVEFGGVVAVVG
jgi:hypothetical protein